MSSATGMFIKTNLCVKRKNSRRKHISKETTWQQGRKSAEVRCRDKKEGQGLPSPIPVSFSPLLLTEAHWLLLFFAPGEWCQIPREEGLSFCRTLQGPKNVFDQDSKNRGLREKESAQGGLHSCFRLFYNPTCPMKTPKTQVKKTVMGR